MDLELSNGQEHHQLHEGSTQKGGWWKDILLAYETVGVVFGGIATSPLYIFNSLRFKGSSPTQEDYLGIFSIMFWTLTLIGIVKYICIALNADDHGEGGTFALYSLLCKHSNLHILASQSSSRNVMMNKDKGRLESFIEKSMAARKALMFIAILGMCMLIGDGVLTPAISVLSAIDGLKGQFHSISKGVVEALSAAILVVLFLVQRFGAARVSFLFSPIMVAWAVSTPLIGIYHISRYNLSVLKALSPHYIVDFFLRNGKEGWHLLGGIVIVITGAEAMFADLGHFNKRSIRVAFILLIYPSLLLTYAGQITYLLNHLDDYKDGFYKFVPHSVYWPMFIIATLSAIVASQSLISAAFSVIKQSVLLDYFPRVTIVHTSMTKEGEVYSPEINHILMVLCVAVTLGFGDVGAIGNAYGLVVIFVMLITTLLLTIVMIVIWKTPLFLALLYFIPFFILESVYLSSVLSKFLSGGWFPLAISTVLATVMFSWYYGRQKKYEYEQTNKTGILDLEYLLSSNSEIIQRAPGLCIFYTEIQDGSSPLFFHYLKNMHTVHEVIIFTTIEFLLVPKVDPRERFTFRRMGLKGLYGCLVHYGYADSLDFGNSVVEELKAYIKNRDSYENDERINDVRSEEEEVKLVEDAKGAGVVHLLGKTRLFIGRKNGWFERVLLGIYMFLHSNCKSSLPALGIPLEQRVEIGMIYNV